MATVLANAARLAQSAPSSELFQTAIHAAESYYESHTWLAAANIQAAARAYSTEPTTAEQAAAYRASIETDFMPYGRLLDALDEAPAADQPSAIDQAPTANEASVPVVEQAPVVDEIDGDIIRQVIADMQAREDMKNENARLETENARLETENARLEKQVEEQQAYIALLEAQVKTQ